MVTGSLIPLDGKESLTPAEFNALSDIPSELEWLANITNPKTRRAYKVDVAEFNKLSGLPRCAKTFIAKTVKSGQLTAENKQLLPAPTIL